MKPEDKKKYRQRHEEAIKSKQQQKRLAQIKFRRRSKQDRSQLLGDLKKYRLNNDQVAHLHTTASMQTIGLKRFANLKVQAKDSALLCLDPKILLNKKKPKIKLRKNHDSGKNGIESISMIESEEENSLSLESDTEETHPVEKDKELTHLVEKDKEVTSIRETPQEATHSTETVIEATPPKEPEVKKSDPALYIQVQRDPIIHEARLQLPIINEEQNIIETIRYNDIVLISGETGCGKTTQIPQFLFEAGYTLNGRMIAVTEPRRIAAISMSQRVAKELNLTPDEVSYQIRFEGNVTDKSCIKFLTDGVLLRECQHDFLLKKYSVVVIDEAHERSIFSDILIGLLSRIVPLRAKQGNPLKLIIMSATLRVEEFTQNNHLFKSPPPVINVEARQFTVTNHFSKTTPINYLSAAYKKVRTIHKKLPKGGILVFVASQMDVKILCKKLKMNGLHCVGLYAMLPMDKQKLVFKTPPNNMRLCVIATNVAETSITIPNIKYVVDSGKEKTKIYDLNTGVSRLITVWTSKSSAEQRKGRAGRVGPGHCYRLYSSAVYTNDFIDHPDPPILGRPVDDIILQMKSMNIENVVNFPFPTRPSIETLMAAEKRLIMLGALDDSKIKNARFSELNKVQYSGRITSLGNAMSRFAVGARYSKMIVHSPNHLIHHIAALIASLTVREMFVNDENSRKIRKKLSGRDYFHELGDFGVMLKVVCKSDSSNCSSSVCSELGLRTKAMLEIFKIKKQLISEITTNFGHISSSNKIEKPNELETKTIGQLLLSSFPDHVARKVPDGEITERSTDDPNKVEKRKLKQAYECLETESLVYISQDSVLKGEHPEFLIYRELYEGENKVYMRDTCVIDPSWLPYNAPNMCTFSEKTTLDSPKYDSNLDHIICTRSTTYGRLNWPLGILDVPMHHLDTGVEIFKYFAFFLLSGNILAWFKIHYDKLLVTPSIMLKPWSKLQPRTSKLLNALVSMNIKSRKDLIQVWTVDKEYLKREYLMWIPESNHGIILKDWEMLVANE